MSKEKFLDRFIQKLDNMESNSIQAYILRLSKEKGFMDTVFNTIREGIIVIDRKLRIRYYNKAAKELLGLPEDLSKLRISSLLRDIDWKKLLQEDEEEWYRVSRQEIEILYPKRSIIQFYLVPNEGSGGNATVILNDVTESREKTKSEMESEKLNMVSLLAAGVAHEIGNPLNSLYLHLQCLQRQFSSGSVDINEAKDLLNISKSEVERLDSIITQFLSALRPAKPDIRTVDIKELIIESLNFMRSEIENRSVKVKCTWPDFLPKIQGDSAQLKQAFYNILKNSMQAMPEGGKIEIHCSFDEDHVKLSFVDTGKGIKPEDIGKIFEPYHSSKKNGSGLGLMIVERIIREHGAELSLDSTPGKGTVFTIRFPLHVKRMRVLPAPVDDKTKS